MTGRTGRRAAGLAALTSCLVGGALVAQEPKYEVRLKKKWVETYADRTTIEASMEVRHAHKKPNPVDRSGDDGDMHFSGTASAVGLPFVAEAVNAKLTSLQPAVKAIIAQEGASELLEVAGAWRLWFEHPSTSQTQGGNNPFEPDHTNPDHSFEIHPLSAVGPHDIGASFVPIAGYTAYSAAVAFPYFDQQRLVVKASASGISLRSGKLKYNYVEFECELVQKPKAVADGVIALATLLTDDEEAASEASRRLIFVGGTKAAAAIAGAAAGSRWRLLGIPRINLNAILFLVGKHGTQQFEAKLPYEMIVVGVIP